jgi:hypothetical protein
MFHEPFIILHVKCPPEKLYALQISTFNNPLLHMLFLDSFTMKVYNEQEDYLEERKETILNGFENICGKWSICS